jgi:pimeloyl-ACP methyl ester carboxylesterase
MRPLAACCLVLLGAGCGATRAEDRAPRPEPRRTSAPDGTELAYEAVGTGEPALVLVHGWTGDRELWRRTLEDLARDHRVVALDLAGHGDSQARAEPSLAAYALDVAAVIAAEGLTDCILVGHSLGAPVALLATATLAPRVRAVIAVESLHDVGSTYPPGTLAAAADELERDFPRALEGSIRASLGPAAGEELAAWLVARALRTDRPTAVATLRALEGRERAAALAAARVPVRALNAAPGSTGRLATAVEANRRHADFDAVLLEHVGHFPMLEDPPAFRTALRGLLSALESSTIAR